MQVTKNHDEFPIRPKMCVPREFYFRCSCENTDRKIESGSKKSSQCGSDIPNVNTWDDLHLTSDLLRSSGGLFGSWLVLKRRAGGIQSVRADGN
jgi:hypothetical protein